MIKAVVFDFDGTLTNRRVGSYKTYLNFFKQKFPEISDLEKEKYTQDCMLLEANGTHSETGTLLKKKYKLNEDFEKELSSYYTAHIVNNIELRDGVFEVLTKLRKTYKLGLLTNGSCAIQYGKIAHVGVRDYFDCVLASEEIGYNKPDTRAFKAVCDKLGFKEEETVYVGDIFSGDIYGASMAGLTPIWLVGGEIVTTYNCLIIKNLNEIEDILLSLNNK